MRRARFALVALAVLVAGCGGDPSDGEATTAFVPPPPPDPEVADVLDDLEPFPADSLGRDSVLAETPNTILGDEPVPSTPPPTFAPFLRDFKEALQTGDARRFAAPTLSASDLALVAEDPAFSQRVLEAGPERYRRDGTRREVYVVVGYDLDGNIVPEDEAETESSLGLVFDVVDGAYKLVRVEPAG